MNKYKECFDYIVSATNGGEGIAKQLNAIKELVDKETPKKPDYEGDGYDDNGQMIYDTWICPNCGKRYEVDYDDYDYCPNCGQRLDWGKDNG